MAATGILALEPGVIESGRLQAWVAVESDWTALSFLTFDSVVILQPAVDRQTLVRHNHIILVKRHLTSLHIPFACAQKFWRI
jgi:hypothetical protein